jgi:signal transduction histidine kinase
LYITKNILEAHGGRIWAENNKSEKGATFTFTLPISG